MRVRSLNLVAVATVYFGVAACIPTTAADPAAGPEPTDAGPGPALSDAASPAPDAGNDLEPQGDPAIRYVGRFDTRESAGPRCSWPGCRIIARFEGDTVSVRLRDRAQSWQEANGTNEWDAIVDGVTTRLTTLRSETQFDLARGLSKSRSHTVELMKRSGPHHGDTQFLGFDFHGGRLLAPPPAKTRRIAIVGDSQSYGFGILGSGTCDNADAAKYEHFGRSYPALLGARFDADVSAVSYPGKGLVQNIWRPDTLTMPTLVRRALGDDATSTYDFASFVPDLVVIQLGSNDFSIGSPTDSPAPTQTVFQGKLREMVQLHRSHYPQALIVLVISPSTSDGATSGHMMKTNVRTGLNAIASEFANAGDARVITLEPSQSPESELTACRHHGNDAFHQRLASLLGDLAAPKLGW